jgi:hypothetical protein
MARVVQLSRDLKARITKEGKVTLIPWHFTANEWSEEFSFPIPASAVRKLCKAVAEERAKR